jgi:hypothetical protein
VLTVTRLVDRTDRAFTQWMADPEAGGTAEWHETCNKHRLS